MLVMAIEALVETEAREATVVAHVDDLISRTQAATLPANEIDSTVGSLRWLREESINQAGRRLVSVRVPRIYGALEPQKFFTKCYKLRSRLVHGTQPTPSQDEVEAPQLGPLRDMVSDLLQRPTPRVGARGSTCGRIGKRMVQKVCRLGGD